MRPAWIGDYLQIPFLEKGRTREGLDCYGLVRQIFHDQRSIDMPSYTEGYLTTADADEIAALYRGGIGTHWTEIPVDQAQLFDVVILRIRRAPMHFGLVVDPPYFLHIQAGIWSCLERWDSLIWKRRLMAVARWQHA